ncbi:MAG: HEAT repeat domain-containing protein [Planctomycetota bacterium]
MLRCLTRYTARSSRKSWPDHLAGWVMALGLCALMLGCKSTGSGEGDGFFDDAFTSAPSPVEAVAMATDTTDPDRRRQGILWLSAAPFGGEGVYLELYRLFHNDPNPNVRAASARALGLHGTTDDAALLMLLVEDEDSFTRWQAANGLRMIHNLAAVDPLVGRLDPLAEEDPNVRCCAADALGQYPSITVLNSLIVALEDRDFSVVEAARGSLRTLTGHDAGLDPRAWAAWSSENANNLFDNQQPYTYQPYTRPRYWVDYISFWDEIYRDEPPRVPTGLEG